MIVAGVPEQNRTCGSPSDRDAHTMRATLPHSARGSDKSVHIGKHERKEESNPPQAVEGGAYVMDI